jgi:hypothetical protein
MLALWRPVAIARPSRTREVRDRLNFSCFFVRCMKNIAKGSEGAVVRPGIAVLNKMRLVFYHLNACNLTSVGRIDCKLVILRNPTSDKQSEGDCTST